MLDVLVEVIGKGQGVQRAADDGLRLVALGHLHRRKPSFARRRPSNSGR